MYHESPCSLSFRAQSQSLFHQKSAHNFKFYCEKNFENINSVIRNYETNAKTEDKKEY